MDESKRLGTPYSLREVRLFRDGAGAGHLMPYPRDLIQVALNKLKAMEALALKHGASEAEVQKILDEPDWLDFKAD